MKRKSLISIAGLSVAAGAVALTQIDRIKSTVADARQSMGTPSATSPAAKAEPPAPAVSVARVATADFNETVMVSGSLVAREEVLVAPEVEGLRVLAIEAEQGDRVKKGQVLARLVTESLDAQLAQNSAALARSDAAIAQARSTIVQAESRLTEAKNAYDRARPLKQAGHMPESTLDQREAAAKTAEAQLVAARDGLKAAEAEKAQVSAQRREVEWRLGNTEIRSPVDGVVSRRSARIGAVASGAGEPLFRIVTKGEVELDAEVPEAKLAKVKEGQRARLMVPGLDEVTGTVRLVSPEIDPLSRLGKLRIFLGDKPGLRIGGFARGVVDTATSRGPAVPVSALIYGNEGVTVQVIVNDTVVSRRVAVGLNSDGLAEIKSGVAEGELVVTRAGTFLRDGDRVRPIMSEAPRVSDAQDTTHASRTTATK